MAGLPVEGAAFGRYDLGRRIGRGGMGVVFEATHRELQRPVALKVLLAEMLDVEAFRHRFIREARALAAVDSPFIVPVFDAGEQDGWLFIATKLFADGDLGDWISENGALSQAESIAVMAQVAEGVADAHEAGFLHRDIKPSNVLVQRRPAGLRAVICDFGIALAEGNEHTKTVGVIGTLGYMAPERHEGHPATAASDIYSLGCVLHACLTGRAPWVGTDVKVAMGHLYEPVPQLPEASDALNRLLARALAKDPADRFPTVGEFKAALLQVESGAVAKIPEAEPVRPEAVDLPDVTERVSVLPSLDPATVAGATGANETNETDETVLTGAVVEDPTIVAAREDVAADVAEDAPEGAPAARRSWRTWSLVAAAVLLIAGLALLPFLLGGGGGGTPSAASGTETVEPSPSASASASASASTPPITPRVPPEVKSRSRDLAVDFDFSFSPAISSIARLEYSRDAFGARWSTDSSSPVTMPTTAGGQRVCILARTRIGYGSASRAGPSTRVCGSSKPKTLDLRLTGECIPAEAGCTEVTVSAAGLRSGRSISGKIFLDGELYTAGCVDRKEKSVPCIIGKPDSGGTFVQRLSWPGPVLMTVELAGLTDSVQLP